MHRTNRVLGCAAALVAAGIVTGGCTGPEARVAGETGPVFRSPDDYRVVRFNEAWRGLRIEQGLIVVDRKAAAGLEAGDPGEAIARGDRLLRESNGFTGAVGEYRSALLADPTSVEALVGLGEALLGRKDDTRALAAFRTASTLAPEDSEIRLKYAETLNRTGDLEGWASELEALLAADPRHGEAHARLAVARWYQGDAEAARRQAALAERFGGTVPPQLKAMLEN